MHVVNARTRVRTRKPFKARARLESDDEKLFVAEIGACGGECLKVVLRNGRGYPDRSVFYRGRKYVVELKRAGDGELSEHQKKLMKRITRTGCDVYILWGTGGVRTFCEKLVAGTLPPDSGAVIHYG